MHMKKRYRNRRRRRERSRRRFKSLRTHRSVYLDLNIYDDALKSRWASRLSPTLQASGAIVYGSGELLIEAMRISGERFRRQTVGAIVRTVRQRLAPVGYRHAAEIVSEIRRCRPAMLAAKPDKRSELRALQRAREVWRRVERNPSYLPWGMVNNAGLLHQALGSGRDGQRARRALVAKHQDPDVLDMLGTARSHLEARVQVMPPVERHWRVVGAALWWDALLGDPQLADMKTWMGGYLRPIHELNRTDWMIFWCNEIDPDAVQTHVAEMLAEFHQIDPGVKLSTSNALDVLHVPYLFSLDLVVTADKSFAKVLQQVRKGVTKPIADVRLFDPSAADHPAELARLLH